MCKILTINNNQKTVDYFRQVTKKLNRDIYISSYYNKSGDLECLNKKYDIVLLGMETSSLKGLTILKEIRKTNKIIPIIMLSLFNDKKNFKKAIEYGANDIFINPLTLNKLESIINKYVV